jgi:hypothetical protein
MDNNIGLFLLWLLFDNSYLFRKAAKVTLVGISVFSRGEEHPRLGRSVNQHPYRECWGAGLFFNIYPT